MATKKRKARKGAKKSRSAKYKVTTAKMRTVSKHNKLAPAKKAAKRAARKSGQKRRVHGPGGKIVAVCGPKSCTAP